MDEKKISEKCLAKMKRDQDAKDRAEMYFYQARGFLDSHGETFHGNPPCVSDHIAFARLLAQTHHTEMMSMLTVDLCGEIFDAGYRISESIKEIGDCQ